MSTFRERIEKGTFLITKNNFSETESRLYGICYKDDSVYCDCPIKTDEMVADSVPEGCYTSVFYDRHNSEIRIRQDCCSSFYVYYYQTENDFAVSNSFFCLCEEVAKHHPLTLDEEYFESFCSVGTSMITVNRSLSKEIKMLPLFCFMIITKNKGIEIRKNYLLYEAMLDKIPINTKAGMRILDKWISKWATRIKSLHHGGHLIKFDLSGGFDSRVSFALGLAAGIDLNASNILVYSSHDRKQTSPDNDDWKIAYDISKHYGFHLSDQYNHHDGYNVRNADVYETYRRFMSNIHRDVYFPRKAYQKPVFYVNGLSGESIRGWKGSRGCFGYITMANHPYGESSQKSTPTALWDSLLSDWSELPDFSDDAFQNTVEQDRYFFLSVRNRSHMGAVIHQNLFFNYWQMTNFSDPEILRLSAPEGFDLSILPALIYSRIDKDLLSFPFSDTRSISEETRQYAERLCDQYPSNVKVSCRTIRMESDYLDKPHSVDYKDDINPYEKLFERFSDPEGKELFLQKFQDYGKLLYDDAERNYHNKDLKHYNQYIAVIGTAMEMLKIEWKSSRYHEQNMMRREQSELKDIFVRHPEFREMRKNADSRKNRSKPETEYRTDQYLLYGLGEEFEVWYHLIPGLYEKIGICIDPTRNSSIIHGHPVFTPDLLRHDYFDDCYIVIMNTRGFKSAKALLINDYGIPGNRILSVNTWIAALLQDNEVSLRPDRVRIDTGTFHPASRQNDPMQMNPCAVTETDILHAGDFRRFLIKNPHIRQIELSGNNSSFFDRELPAILQFADELHVEIGFSNGIDLHPISDEGMHAIVKYGVKYISFSINAASPEVYGKQKKNGDFSTVIQSIRRLNDFKRKHHSDYPQLHWQYALKKDNECDICAAKRLAQELGMEITFMLSCSDDYLPQNPDVVSAVTGFSVFNRQDYFSKYGKPCLLPCRQMLTSPLILWDGRLSGCSSAVSRDWNVNVFTDYDYSLDKAVNDEEYRNGIISLLTGDHAVEHTPCVICKEYHDTQITGFHII